MKPAALYARVSSERQKEDQTIASQLAALIEHARNEGYTVPDEWIFQDEGYSGAMLVRPGLEKLRDLAAEGQIEAVLVYSPDRLSRKYAYQVLLVEELSRNGVDVVFIRSPKADTPEDKLMLQFQGMIAEYERAQIVERTRRGKRHRAKAGSVNALSAAPYGYRYVKKTESSSAYYEILEKEAEIVRKVFDLYTQADLTISGIVRWLNDNQVPTRKGLSYWERKTVWHMLRNPAHKGTACFGKTEQTERQKMTRPSRQRGGFSPQCGSTRERPRDEWLEIKVPAIIAEDTFALAQEQLEQNKRLSPRRTIEPTLLQGMLVCGECGYALYRVSASSTKKKLIYYRCSGTDNYRFPNGRRCNNQPVRQDFLDKIVWGQVIQLLEDPGLIRVEIERRIREIQDSNPTRMRKEVLLKEMARADKSVEKLLDAYQENLLDLEELRKRMPELRKRQTAIRSELQAIEVAAADQQTFLRLAENIETFLGRLRERAETMDVVDRQKLLRLVVKEIQVDRDTIKIKHSIPISRSNPPPRTSVAPTNLPSYLLRGWSHEALSGHKASTWLSHAEADGNVVL
jgi:site-specific DNA recombinase